MMVDPWLDLYLPAVLGETEAFEGALEQISLLPQAQRGEAWAVAARGFLVLGREADAWKAFESARESGGNEYESLATFMVGAGVKRAGRRASAAASPGRAADACCDAAALSMTADDLEGAERAIGQALELLPHHREARQWYRFLAEPDALRAWRRASIAEGKMQPQTPALGDAVALIPRRDTGWVCSRRWHERYVVAGSAAMAPKGTALAALFDAGRSQFLLATELDWAAVPATHALVAAELALGEVEDLVQEERPAFAVAHRAWTAALSRNDRAEIDDIGQALCALATRSSDLVPLAIEAVGLLRQNDDAECALYLAYSAWLRSRVRDPQAVTEAVHLLALPAPGELPFMMAIDALRTLGHHRTARKALLSRTGDPSLTHAVRRLRDETVDPIGQGIVCSPRLTPRGLAMSSPGFPQPA